MLQRAARTFKGYEQHLAPTCGMNYYIHSYKTVRAPECYQRLLRRALVVLGVQEQFSQYC